MFNLPVAQYPQISPPQITVSAIYPGASADVVEQTIAQIIEQKVNGVEGATSIESTSSDNGRYWLNVEFELEKDADDATVQVQNRVAQANGQLPQEVLNIGVTTFKRSPDTVMFFSLISPDKTYDNLFLKNYGSINIVDEIRRVKGVGEVSEYGADYGMRIWLQPDKMARLGITANDLYLAIHEQNKQAPAGSIGQMPAGPEQQFQYTATVKGRLTTPEEFADIIIIAKPDGSFVRVGDVARVEMAQKEYMFNGALSGSDSATFAIQLTSDANALETVSEVRKIIEEAAKTFPPDMEHKIVVDNTKFVQASLNAVIKTFVEALILVLLIVYLFLQSWRATLIPMLAVPVSIIGTFGAFLVLGFSINTLTLFAMVLAIGLVVDDAIVVVEAVEHNMRHKGMTPHDATIRAMEDVSGPVIAIAFVLASVFIPVAFFGGTMGVLYKQFALTIVVSMALSALVALTLTPALCSLLLKPYSGEKRSGLAGRFFAAFNAWFERLLERYSQGVQRAIKRTGMCMVGLLLIVVMAGGLYKTLPTSFVPEEDQGFFLAAVSLPEASSLNRTKDAAAEVGKAFRSIPGVKDTVEISGFDILSSTPKTNGALVVGALEPWEERTTPELQVNQIIGQAMAKARGIPEANVLVFNVPALPGIGSVGGISMMLQDKGGGTIEEFDKVSKDFIAAARKRPEIGMINSSLRIDTPSYNFEVDREKAKKLGVPVDDVFNALQTFLGGLQVNDFNKYGRTYKVIMQAEPQYRSDIEATRFLFVRSSAGTMVPLNTLIKPVASNGPTSIKRFNVFRAVQINGSPAPGYTSGQAMAALEEVSREVLPSNYGYEWTGQSREEKISGGKAPIIFGFAILFSFLCLAALYESWRIPFAVLLSVPTGIFGALLAQYGRGFDINIYMQIGLIMIVGLAAKNAILIVEYAKIRVDKGMDLLEATIEASKLRLRPILMTSLAFIMGCLPLALSSGAGAGARTAMGTAVVGGMMVATMLGIFIIPVLFMLIERISMKKTTDTTNVTHGK